MQVGWTKNLQRLVNESKWEQSLPATLYYAFRMESYGLNLATRKHGSYKE